MIKVEGFIKGWEGTCPGGGHLRYHRRRDFAVLGLSGAGKPCAQALDWTDPS